MQASHYELEYVLGRKIIFLCTARGNPRPRITWYKDGVELYAHNYFQVTSVDSLRTHRLATCPPHSCLLVLLQLYSSILTYLSLLTLSYLLPALHLLHFYVQFHVSTMMHPSLSHPVFRLTSMHVSLLSIRKYITFAYILSRNLIKPCFTQILCN